MEGMRGAGEDSLPSPPHARPSAGHPLQVPAAPRPRGRARLREGKLARAEVLLGAPFLFL